MNKYEVADPYFRSVNHNDLSRCFTIWSLLSIWSLNFGFMCEVEKK